MANRETLTSRERVIRTLKRQPVDRMPIDLGSHMSTGISAFAYHELREYLGLSTDSIWVPDLVCQLAYVDEDIRQRFHLDCVLLEPMWSKPARWNPRGKYQFTVADSFRPQRNGEGDWIASQSTRQMRMPDGGFFFDGDWLSCWEPCDEDHAVEFYGRDAERIYKETPFATNFIGYTRGLAFSAFFWGIERAVQMLEDPDQVKRENEAVCNDYLRWAGKIIDRMGPYIQLISLADDMGMQNAPMCRPSVLEECVAPYLKRFCDFIHRNSDIKVFMHNCGSIRPLIPMLIDCGVDVLNPVQISASNMDAAELKREFGDKIIFWGGGCDTQNILGTRTPQEISDHVRHLIGAFKPGGGFVFNQVHNIMGNVPPANIVALLDTAHQESFYPSPLLTPLPDNQRTSVRL